jgi:DNA polymerase-1
MLEFLKIFGGGADAAAGLIGCSKSEARKVLGDFDAAFPKINEAIDRISKEARRNGFIRTLYGRRLTVNPDFAYKGMNYCVQGSAADLMKRGLRKAGEYLGKSGLDAHTLLTIHDEVVFEIRREHLYPRVIRAIKHFMEDTEGRLPYGIETHFSIATKNWLAKRKLAFNLKD